MKILKDVIAVKKIEVPLTSSIIEIPATADQGYIRPIKAEVKGIGSKFRHAEHIALGDKVFVPNHLGTKHLINGEELFFYDGEDILAVISESRV